MEAPNQIVKEKIQFLWNKNRGKSFWTFIKENKDVDEYLEKLVESDPWFQDKRRAFVCVANEIYEKKRCEVCGKEIDLRKACNGRRFCSFKCASVCNKKRVYDEEAIARANKKREETNLKKYGSAHPMQSAKVREKHKQTCMERYGVENAIQSQEIQKKRKENCLEKYGVDSHFKTKEVREKYKKTCMERYGVESTFSVKSVREKSKQTMLDKYGCENPFQNNEIKLKAEQTCLERYGVRNASHSDELNEKRKRNNLDKFGCEYPTQNEEVKQKRKKTMHEKYGSDSYFQSREFLQKTYNRFQRWKDYVVPLFTVEEYTGWNRGQVYRWKCVKCGNVFEQSIHTTWIDRKATNLPRCLNCYPHNTNSSCLEKEITDFVKSIYSGIIIENDRTLLGGKELDIYLPEVNLAIEMDGLFWHNDKSGKDKTYHLEKTSDCLSQGIQLIHVFEDEWLENQEIVKDRIKSCLGLHERKIFARQCVVKAIEANESNKFLDENHLQGGDNASIRYGLFYKTELVSVMTFGKPRFNDKYEFELMRFCSKMGVQVVGGASKLLKNFEQECKPKSLITYADKRYSIGNVYVKLGFDKVKDSEPNYWWQKNQVKLSRYQCQKHKLSSILGTSFNSDLTEEENMELNGWNRIYDCGNIVFIKMYNVGMTGPDLGI